MTLENVFNNLKDRGYNQYAYLEKSNLIEYRFYNGNNIIKVFYESATSNISLEQ